MVGPSGWVLYDNAGEFGWPEYENLGFEEALASEYRRAQILERGDWAPRVGVGVLYTHLNTFWKICVHIYAHAFSLILFLAKSLYKAGNAVT
ncbi:unnamed protein product [marine sediment metagenome]|uniref:Uncharacterized protein n=1 Tax=marine sediment metagenome TaxID=412755 RepID=X1PDJ4_9ZZZZ